MTDPRLKAYYTEARKAELVEFANLNRFGKKEHTIVSVDVNETICHIPFVAFIQDDGERILAEMF